MCCIKHLQDFIENNYRLIDRKGQIRFCKDVWNIWNQVTEREHHNHYINSSDNGQKRYFKNGSLLEDDEIVFLELKGIRRKLLKKNVLGILKKIFPLEK